MSATESFILGTYFIGARDSLAGQEINRDTHMLKEAEGIQARDLIWPV